MGCVSLFPADEMAAFGRQSLDGAGERTIGHRREIAVVEALQGSEEAFGLLRMLLHDLRRLIDVTTVPLHVHVRKAVRLTTLGRRWWIECR